MAGSALADSLFYLNYVGCKGAIKQIKGFGLESFTLTMWDVKLFTSSIVAPSIPSFYLNYVGCKVKFSLFLLFPLQRFTLTMWDVKL